MNIPFSLPVIDADVVNEMKDTLTNTGWLTSGPKVQQLEAKIQEFTTVDAVVCVNSWVSGAMLMLRWFGVGPGDEVIVPAYTYCATALACMNMGATVVMVDVRDDFTIDPEFLQSKINERTKVIIPVDIAGLPCDYESIMALVERNDIKELFQPNSHNQKKMGRILVLSDAAHSIGASYQGKPVGKLADISIFSLHSVKNITTGEGGAICLNLPSNFSPNDEFKYLKALSINGQTKSAFEKNQVGGWRYDIIAQGLKVNMPDICASVGLAQIRKYKDVLLPERKSIAEYYVNALSEIDWAILPVLRTEERESSYHLFQLRIRNFTELQRDQMIQHISEQQVGVNVHYIPMPMLTLFREMGYSIDDYPVAYQLYSNEITLPLYNGLKVEQLQRVVEVVKEAYYKVRG